MKLTHWFLVVCALGVLHARALGQEQARSIVTTDSARVGSKAELPNDVTIELLGRAFVYSFSFQHTIAERLGIEAGLSILGGSGGSVAFFNGGARLYATTKDASPCIAGGFGVVTASTSAGPGSSGSSSYLYIGPGFEYRPSGGFLFRGTVYYLVGDGWSWVWPGAQIGIAF